VKKQEKVEKFAWTSGKFPLMTKGGSLPGPRAGMRNGKALNAKQSISKDSQAAR